ncbi:MAG TPA: phosphoserine transaminase [Methylocella sp.]|nr:phosphoserine transaminase [Methylocella sp.]
MSLAAPAKPNVRPTSPNFSCGPCTKPPGWSFDKLKTDSLGRSHRAKLAKERLKLAIDESKALLELPKDYIAGIIGGSDTGAVEAALWNLLGPRPVDAFAWEAFGKDWVIDCTKQLKPLDVRGFVADYGQLPDLKQADPDHDIVFTWNGTAAGVIVPNGDWISDNRKGLTICDATSCAFAVPLPWEKLDVVTFSWQKVLGGEAMHGVLILSPRAIERLESHKPQWPIPKLFRLTKDGKLNAGIFEGTTINTPSMMCVEDALAAMQWARSVGGQNGMAARTHANFKVLREWVERTKWIDFLAANPATRSPISVTLRLADPALTKLSKDEQAAFCKKLVALVEAEGAGHDFNAYRDAPPGLRIWCGATVEASDIAALTQWIDWAYAVCRAELKEAA